MPADGSPGAEQLIRLQQTVGNAAVSDILNVQRQRHRSRRGSVQLIGVTVLWRASNVFVQQGPTCSAASVVAELAIRDNDRADPQHHLIGRAMASVAAYANAHRAQMLPALERFIIDGSNRRGERLEDQVIRQGAAHLLTSRVLDPLAGTGGPVGDRAAALATLSQALFYAFLRPDGQPPSTAEVGRMLQAIGLPQPTGGAVDNIRFSRFDEIFSNSLTVTLPPGAAVRTTWWVRRRDNAHVRHVFTVGRRRSSGSYYLYDQGVGYGRESADLADLRAAVMADIRNGDYWLATFQVTPEFDGEANLIPASPP
ncbi:hypothetical protein AB0J55_21795 [Amycolatopsis sp. NPDC049688]|uniref:hypothetical protein n=1 Tax=Amycolatopsis sp. NPDC049688 TaxID=3154733 RepID=UPI003435DD24